MDELAERGLDPKRSGDEKNGRVPWNWREVVLGQIWAPVESLATRGHGKLPLVYKDFSGEKLPGKRQGCQQNNLSTLNLDSHLEKWSLQTS